MSASKELIPLVTVKKWSKTLSKIWVEAGGNQKPTLSVSQEAIARILGYKNWQELSSSYSEQLTKEEDILIKQEASVADPFIPLIGEIDFSKKEAFIDYWDKVFSSLVSQQSRGLFVELSEQTGKVSIKNSEGVPHFVEHADRKTLLDLFRVLYNVVAVNKDVSFDERAHQKACLQGKYNQEDCVVFYNSRPFGLHDVRMDIDILSTKEKMVPLPVLTEPSQALQVISSPHLSVRTWLVSHLVRNLLHEGLRVVVVSDNTLLVNSHPNLVTTYVFHRLAESVDESREYAVRRGRNLLDEENFDVFIVNTPMSAQLLKKISLPVDKRVFVVVNETHATELTRNLEQQQCKLQGRFIGMRKEFLAPTNVSKF